VSRLSRGAASVYVTYSRLRKKYPFAGRIPLALFLTPLRKLSQ